LKMLKPPFQLQEQGLSMHLPFHKIETTVPKKEELVPRETGQEETPRRIGCTGAEILLPVKATAIEKMHHSNQQMM
jgi:hypothetical protein